MAEPVNPDAAWACESAMKKMRDAVGKRREQHRKEIDVVAAAFVAHAGGPAHPGKCTHAQFRAAWASLGVKNLSDEEVDAIFSRVGVDAAGLMPHDVFTRSLAMGGGRSTGMEAIKKGPFVDANDADFLGKVVYPQCRRGVTAPTDWLAAARGITRQSAAEPTASLALDFVNGLPGASIGNALKVTPCGKVVYYVAALGVVYDRATNASESSLRSVRAAKSAGAMSARTASNHRASGLNLSRLNATPESEPSSSSSPLESSSPPRK